MLVLSRKKLQAIRIGQEDVELTVLEIRGSTVKIGINAPDDVPVWRGELGPNVEAAVASTERGSLWRVARYTACASE